LSKASGAAWGDVITARAIHEQWSARDSLHAKAGLTGRPWKHQAGVIPRPKIPIESRVFSTAREDVGLPWASVK